MRQTSRFAPSLKKLLPLLALGLLTACTVSTPFHSTQPNAGRDSGEVVLSITHVVLKDDSRARARFREAVRRVDETMRTQPGLVGCAKRLEVFGDEAWTVSAWKDLASLQAFVQSDAHRQAMAEARESWVDARFARASLPGRRLPPPWSELLATLDRSARHYYE